MNKGFKFIWEGKDYSQDIKGGIKAMMAQSIYEKINKQLGHLISEVDAEGGQSSII